CPRTAANEAALGRAGREKTGPQLFVTTVFHVGTGLPWDVRRGTGTASERSHLLEMLGALPAGALLLADAGFTGYDLMAAVAAGGGGGAGRHFLIRAGANVRLLRGLGWCCDARDGVVCLWPDKAQKTRKRPPLVLRQVTLTDGRNRRMHLLTDVLDPAALPDADAAALYARRWTAEVLFRSLKQTMGRRTMVCGNPAHAGAELDWAVVGPWALGLMAADAVAAAGDPPARVSVARALTAVRRAIGAAPAWVHRRVTLAAALAAAVRDGYVRTRPKGARVPVDKKRDRPPGDPVARTATPAEVALAAELKEKLRAA
ncbi:MAG: transposase, partial [Phycisphaerae bacterium]